MHRHYPRRQRDKTGLAKRIESARQKLDLSQPAAATQWGLSVRTLQNWEAGRNEPRGFARAQLEKLLDGILGPKSGNGRKK